MDSIEEKRVYGDREGALEAYVASALASFASGLPATRLASSISVSAVLLVISQRQQMALSLRAMTTSSSSSATPTVR